MNFRETKEAVDHAVVFENVALNDGANEITAKTCCGVEDTITLNGVAVHNDAYTLPDIAAAMASMLTTVRDMMGFGKLADSLSMTGPVSPKQLAQLNRQLIKIKK